MSIITASFGEILVTFIPKLSGMRPRKSPICFDDSIFYKLVTDISCYLLPSLPYVLKTGVKLQEFIFQTDKHNVKGYWKWKNQTVCIVELSSSFHDNCVGAILERPILGCQTMIDTPAMIKFLQN